MNEAIFTILEKRLTEKNKKKFSNGRPGMHLWQMFVLAVLRHTFWCNWDKLLVIANSDGYVRQLLGVGHLFYTYDTEVRVQY